MQTIERIHDAIRAAEKAPDADGSKAHLLEARAFLAEAVVAGENPDRRRLEQFAILAGSRAQRLHREGGREGLPWGSLLVAIGDYLESGQVPMPDGSVATKHGWSGAPNDF